MKKPENHRETSLSGLEVVIEPLSVTPQIGVWMFKKLENGKYLMAEPVEFVFREVDEAEVGPGPTMKIDRLLSQSFFQGFSKALHKAGYFDAKIEDLKDVLVQKDKHLEDMRAIAFHKTGVTPPEEKRDALEHTISIKPTQIL